LEEYVAGFPAHGNRVDVPYRFARGRGEDDMLFFRMDIPPAPGDASLDRISRFINTEDNAMVA
jgi:hypothetical protein